MCKEKVSVIIPVYNARKTIRRCIDSIVRQTYGNLEIIIVEDGTEDYLNEEIGEFFDRISIICQKDKGVASARNTGFDAARGEYIAYVDSDDYVSENYIESLVETLKNTDAQFCMSAVVWCDHGIENFGKMLPELMTGKEILINFLDGKIGVSVWGGIYKKSFIKKYGIYFVPNRKCEDSEYKFKCCYYAERVAFCGEARYMVLNTADSVCNTYSNRFLDLFTVMQGIEEWLVQDGTMDDLKVSWNYFYLSRVLWLLEYGTRFYKESKGSFLRKVRQNMKMSFWSYPIERAGSWKKKVKIMLLRIHPYLYCAMFYFRTVRRMQV